MTEIRMVKVLGGAWQAAAPVDAELLKAWKVGDIVKFKASKPRNGPQHRLMWALVDLVFDNQEIYDNKTRLMDEIKFQIGHVETHRTLGGKTVYIPKSISYDAMSQADFRVFMDSAIVVICKYFLPGISAADVLAEAERMMAG